MGKRWFIVGVTLSLAILAVFSVGLLQQEYNMVRAGHDVVQTEVDSWQSDLTKAHGQIGSIGSNLAELQTLYTYDGYAINDDNVQRYLEKWWTDKNRYNVVGDICGDYRGYGTAMRFTGVNIPQGAVIQEAYLIFVAASTETLTQGCRVYLRCEDAYDPEPITSYDDHVGRPRTVKYTYWGEILAWLEGQEYQSRSIKDAVQEVVDKHGGTGDAFTVFFEDPYYSSNDGRYRKIASVENPDYAPAKLHIEYLAAEQGPVDPVPVEPGIELEIRQVRPVGDSLEIDIVPVEYPYVSPYTVSVSLPITLENVTYAICAALPDIRKHIETNKALYDQLESMGLLIFNTDDICN